jgi:hypothetical protein
VAKPGLDDAQAVSKGASVDESACNTNQLVANQRLRWNKRRFFALVHLMPALMRGIFHP